MYKSLHFAIWYDTNFKTAERFWNYPLRNTQITFIDFYLEIVMERLISIYVIAGEEQKIVPYNI